MHKYKLLSIAIVFGCILVSLGIIQLAFDQYQDLISAKTSLELYKSNPVDALDPTITNSGSISIINAELIIPKLGIEGIIRSDTVNGYNTVYHYSESVNPGENGECGLLSHRTKYSGLFGKLGTLKVGDTVIINDYTNSKKYVYKVTSNGNDIRWDYKENPIQFEHGGEARLLLITCYPPGKKQAAYITHCKLVSTTSLT
ncbi:class E sortase [Methanobacterium oryzae]|uniref:class E sortase n=1 Tax=Methanobacterium oryzae TaxID=69540 RepID=UPI003D1A7C48